MRTISTLVHDVRSRRRPLGSPRSSSFAAETSVAQRRPEDQSLFQPQPNRFAASSARPVATLPNASPSMRRAVGDSGGDRVAHGRHPGGAAGEKHRRHRPASNRPAAAPRRCETACARRLSAIAVLELRRAVIFTRDRRRCRRASSVARSARDSSILAASTAASNSWPLRCSEHAQQPFDLLGLGRIAQHAADLGQHFRFVEKADPVPGREVGEIPGRRIQSLAAKRLFRPSAGITLARPAACRSRCRRCGRR